MRKIIEVLKTIIRFIWGGVLDALSAQAEVAAKVIMAVALLIIAVSYCSDIRVDEVQNKRLDVLEISE